MGSRNPEKEMLKRHGTLETYAKMVDSALKSAKTKSKKLVDMKKELQQYFLAYDEAYRLYRADVIAKDATTSDAFNGQDGDGNESFPYNDNWSSGVMDKLMTLTESIEEKIDELEGEVTQDEEKPSAPEENPDHLVTEVESELSSLQQSILAFIDEVTNEEEISVPTATAMEGFSEKLKNRLELLRLKSRKVEDVLRTRVNDFYNTETAKVDSVLLMICKKIPDPPATIPTKIQTSSNIGREQVHLEKSKPPKFKGDETEYPEFKRKWESIVAKANLPEESEVDKLRDSIPVDAADQLYGVTKKAKAWEILDKRFGDAKIISMKLKAQLKSIQTEGKSDPDRVISLSIKVRTIVTKLEALKMSGALEHDSEFLSAVYCALPDKHQTRWLDYTKTSNHWEDMMKFLDRAYDQATEELALLATYKPDSKKKVKVEEERSPSKTFAANVKKQDENAGDFSENNDTESPKEKARKRSEEFCGKCPLCSKPHTWTRNSGDKWPSDRFLSCKKFNDLTVSARAKTVEKSRGCPRCLSWNHARDKCKMPANNCNKEDSAGTKCKGDHSKLLCGSGNAYCFAMKGLKMDNKKATDLGLDNDQQHHGQAGGVSVSDTDFDHVNESADTVFYLQDIPVEGHDQKARTFWDEGSSRVLIREEFAEGLGLAKKGIRYSIEVVGKEVEYMTGHIYLLSLVDMYGKSHRIWGYSIDRIMLSSVPDLSALEKVFPQVPRGAFQAMVDKEVDILIGLNMSHIMPEGGTGVDKSGGIKVKRSKFGSGWVVGGVLDSTQTESVVTSRRCFSSQAAVVRSAKVLIMPEPALSPDFWETDQLGVKPTPRCDRCRKCQLVGECSDSHAHHTMKDQAELDLIKANTKLINGEIWCEYPFVKDPACLPNNRSSAVKVAEKVWGSLKKDDLLHVYNDQVQQILDRKTAVKLSVQEISEYEGPTQYISHHAVLKNSVSTPVRMVTNSSFNNGGRSLNSCLAAGPNSLNPMLDVLMRFRCYCCGMQYDLSKAYNTMRTGVKERHLRRFVWRFSEDDDWEDYAFDVVHFGDRCAATQLEVAKDLAADEGKDIDPVASNKIKEDTYVDDGLTGGTVEEVARFMGVKSADGTFTGTMPQILAKGNFKLKAMVRSGGTDQEQIDKLGGNVFGYLWNVTEDMMGVRFPVNLSRKRRSVRSEPNLTLDDVEKIKTLELCKRNLLGFVNGFSDPAGIASPWYQKLKVLMKKLFLLESPLSWDMPIPEQNRAEWIDTMTEALEQGVLPFPRSTRPATATGLGPTVVGFGDGAVPGFGGSVYLQWKVECVHGGDCEGDGDYDSNLCLSKGRMCPLRGYTIPRSELCGALLVSRLMLAVVLALHKMKECPASAIMLLDSRCIISSLEMTSSKMLPFFQNRLAEIHENFDAIAKKCNVEQVHWVQSDLNPADLLTRGTARLEDIGTGSFHQKGPNFLSSPRDRWPVTRDFVPVDIPEEEVRHKSLNSFAAVRAGVDKGSWIAKVVENVAYYSNSMNKVQRLLARVMRAWSYQEGETNVGRKIITNPRALTMVANEPTDNEMSRAKKFLLVHGMIDTTLALDEGRLASLLPVRQGRLIVTCGRLGEKNMTRLLGVSSLPILMPSCRIAYLYMVMAHEGESGLSNTAVEHHRDAVGTLARSRSYVWVVKGKNLAKKIVNNCTKCRRERRRLETQQMGMLKEAQLTVSPPWTYVSLDFAGPVLAGGEVQKRIRMKCWILVYVDQASRAVCLLLTPGYSTSDFLIKHKEFCARKGDPKKIISDRGSQLVAGSIVVAKKDMPAQAYDWDKVTRDNTCSSWEFVPVGCQWRNQTEAMVKILKTALHHALPSGQVLRYSEMVTLLARVAFSVNSRPLALGDVSGTSQQDDDLMPLTPNQLLLGRTTSEVPDMEYDECDKFSSRLNYIKSVHTEWWRRWIQDVLPSLIPCRKWKNQKRNLMIGDVVMMVYQGNLVDDYRLAKVTKVFPDDRGIVRTVEVSFRKRDRREKPEVYRSKPLVTEKIGVQRLALLQAVGEDQPTGLD